MGKPETYEIVFSQPQAVYQAGQTVRGHVALCLRRPLKMRSISIELVGRGSVHWKDNTGRSGRVVYFRAEEEYFRKKILLFGSGSEDELVHPIGFHSYPFELDLPEGLPSSFEGTFGFVRYSAKVNIDLRLRRDYDIKAAFTVLSHLDLNKEPAMLKIPVQGANHSEVSCCWTASGEISAEFGLDRRGFVSGEMVNVRGKVHNNSNTVVKQSSVSLKQYVEFFGVPDTMFSSKELKGYRMENCLATVERGPIEPGKTDIWSDVLLPIPPAPPSRLDGCSFINIDYAVEFSVVAKYGSKLTFLADIVIGTIPFYDIYTLSPAGSKVITKQPPSVTTSAAADGGELEQADARDAAIKDGASTQLPTVEFMESRQGLVNIREAGDSRTTKGRLLWAPVYITYTLTALRRQQQLHQQQQEQQQKMNEDTENLKKEKKEEEVEEDEVAKEKEAETQQEEELNNGVVYKIETISI